ncbi:hypothetical protein BGZ49_002315 [Haplosporangium sp. Z 27]|nr:hypothetical protein BGZ49_002315 [Haplosporangium sp. Z 27]
MNPVSDPVSDSVNSKPDNNVQRIDNRRNEREVLDSIPHYTYRGNDSYTVQPFILESESSSPILTAWPPAQLNLEYLAPYHPSLHKSVHNWSEIVKVQIRQRRNSGTSVSLTSLKNEAPSNALSTAPEIPAASPSTFNGVLIAPEASSSETGEGAAKVEKHYLFQTHHREPRPQARQHSNDRIQSSRQQPRRRRIRKAVTRPFKRFARYLKKIMVSIKGEEAKCNEIPEKSPPKPTENEEVAVDSEQSIQYLPVEEVSQESVISEQEPQKDCQQQDCSIQGVPKMMTIIDQIMDSADNEPEEVSEQDNGQAVSIHSCDGATDEIVEKSQYNNLSDRGPRMHPKLLELYEVTGRVLGVGTFATVKEIKLKSTGQTFALKIILKRLMQGKGSMLNTEIAVLSKVRHPNCVSLLEMFETEDAVYLVTDLAAGGELFDQLLKKGHYTEGDAARLVREILLGVEYLHSMDIVHRDLKPENLLFLDKSENARLLITDFGLSKVLTNGDDVLMTACGTPGYVAPEILEQAGHGKPVDMWSVGIIAYLLLCGYSPFWGEDQSTLFENIIAGNYEYEPEYWKDISPLAKKFIDSLLVKDTESRATATQALSHPWFRAVLDHDLSAPASPSESVNLLPGVRKNFNAGNMFKKAMRAVGILRRMQAVQQQQQQNRSVPQNVPSRPDAGEDMVLQSFPKGDDPRMTESSVAGAEIDKAGLGSNGSWSRVSIGLKFHDVVGAAVLANQGARMNAVLDKNEEKVGGKGNGKDSECQSEKADSALDMLVVQD